MTRRERLIGAYGLLEPLLAELTQATTVCNACGATRYANRAEFQAAQELAGIINKLARMAEQGWSE